RPSASGPSRVFVRPMRNIRFWRKQEELQKRRFRFQSNIPKRKFEFVPILVLVLLNQISLQNRPKTYSKLWNPLKKTVPESPHWAFQYFVCSFLFEAKTIYRTKLGTNSLK